MHVNITRSLYIRSRVDSLVMLNVGVLVIWSAVGVPAQHRAAGRGYTKNKMSPDILEISVRHIIRSYRSYSTNIVAFVDFEDAVKPRPSSQFFARFADLPAVREYTAFPHRDLNGRFMDQVSGKPILIVRIERLRLFGGKRAQVECSLSSGIRRGYKESLILIRNGIWRVKGAKVLARE